MSAREHAVQTPIIFHTNKQTLSQLLAGMNITTPELITILTPFHHEATSESSQVI